MATTSAGTGDRVPDFVWLADDEDGGHDWFSAPNDDAAMVEARGLCVGYFDMAHVRRMRFTVWDAAEYGEEIGMIEFSIDRPEEVCGRVR